MFYNIPYITKVNIASLNGSEGTGGNITPIKKITDNQGNEYAYISGQAIRRYIKETLMQLGYKITAVDKEGNPNFLEFDEQIIQREKSGKAKGFKEDGLKLMYEKFCDLDLFGYMLPNGGRRWSPVKVTPMVSLFPYKGEYDYLTRKQYVEDESKKSGNIVQIEVDTLNFMRGNLLIDSTSIGCNVNEYTYNKIQMLDDDSIKARINGLIDAVRLLNGGAKKSRNMEDISPKFLAAIKQKTGNPFLLNMFKVDKEDNIIIQPIIEALNDNRDIIESCTFGISSGIFNNQEEVTNTLKENNYKVLSIKEALDTLKIK